MIQFVIALLLCSTYATLAQPTTIPRAQKWADSLVWQTPNDFRFANAEDANLLFIPHAMRYILVYDMLTGVRADTIDLVDVFGRSEVTIYEISCSRDGGVVAVAWMSTQEDSADIVVFRYPSLELIREHVLGDSQPAYKQIEWGSYPITVSPKGTYLACIETALGGMFLHDLTTSNSPFVILGNSYMPVCFDTAEATAVYMTADVLSADSAYFKIIDPSDPDSIFREIHVFDVGETRSTASFGVSADGTELYYAGNGRRLVGNPVWPACGTWEVATGVKSRSVDTRVYNWDAKCISTDGRWLVVNLGGPLSAKYSTFYDRNDSVPAFQIPLATHLVSSDLTHFYVFQRRTPQSLLVYCDTLASHIPTTVNEPLIGKPDGWSVYPNPTDGSLSVRYSGTKSIYAKNVEWKLVDARGTIVSSGKTKFDDGQNTITISTGVAIGYYFLTVTDGQEPLLTRRIHVSR
ncbi:MAG: T9SS type A sorting domain-containing protein [Ignavibacteria bacterium]|nr:T9SS type A sorting domain-containing protein [Ignavibacteria bacterium]MBK7033845.1 T9SS type A sorting domain-containing protein [Ignavibacteria bacterium]MBK7186661.1 T9SS type A sorting domain-containing protein [Ignavibacteria bacterium]MBK9182344.1 T9SS type A sorting domain-containing protein [Ignavibacteria bacterium]